MHNLIADIASIVPILAASSGTGRLALGACRVGPFRRVRLSSRRTRRNPAQRSPLADESESDAGLASPVCTRSVAVALLLARLASQAAGPHAAVDHEAPAYRAVGLALGARDHVYKETPGRNLQTLAETNGEILGGFPSLLGLSDRRV